jgi:predicted transcriptional regulator
MEDNDQTLAGRVSQSVVDDVEAIAEEESSSKSTVVRRFVEQGIERHEAEEEATETAAESGRSVSALALLGVVSLATAPTLLATGYTAAGGVAGAVAAIYVLLWVTATDVVVEEALGDARAELREAGGVVGFFRRVVSDHHVEDPDTVVERAARLDIVAFGLLVGLGVVLLPLGVAAWVGVLGELLATVGSTAATAIATLVMALAYGVVVLMGVSAVASLAIASARAEADAVDDAAAE